MIILPKRKLRFVILIVFTFFDHFTFCLSVDCFSVSTSVRVRVCVCLLRVIFVITEKETQILLRVIFRRKGKLDFVGSFDRFTFL